jgi:hypothetical protein
VIAVSGTSSVSCAVSVVGHAGAGEEVQADVAAHLGPFVVLLG